MTRRFLEDNGVSGVIRSHEVRQPGYSIEHGGQCITVFSAPNYASPPVSFASSWLTIAILIFTGGSSGQQSGDN